MDLSGGSNDVTASHGRKYVRLLQLFAPFRRGFFCEETMRVLVGCEFSGTVRDAFIAPGA